MLERSRQLNLTSIDEVNFVGVLDGVEPVRNDDPGGGGREAVEVLARCRC
jgi:hypothetical protein